MKIKVFVNPNFLYLQEDIQHIPQTFYSENDLIFKKRNELRIIERGGIKLVVKYFRKITWANRIIYRFFRKSKACRSYENALELLTRDVATPHPIAYIEEYGSCTLKRSFFVSRYVDYKNIDFTALGSIDSQLISDFAEFVYLLHLRGVFHRDLNIGNILYRHKEGEQGYQFCLIDNNRLRFCSPTRNKMVKNLNRLFMPFDVYSSFVSE
jgi:serine/threonine protein kinase